jgi:uncharacterized membrane protein YbhN (UPF0104 family)
MNARAKKWLIRTILLVVLGGLLYFALRKAPLAEIGLALQQLQLWQIIVILTLNAFFYVIATLRWWVIVEAENKHVPFFPLFVVRVSVFGVSYFTLGPQVGGEPLQIFALQRKYGLTYTRATGGYPSGGGTDRKRDTAYGQSDRAGLPDRMAPGPSHPAL